MQLQADTENAHLSVQPEIFRQYYPEISENTYLSELHILSEKIPTTLPRIRRESLFPESFCKFRMNLKITHHFLDEPLGLSCRSMNAKFLN